MNSVNSLDKVIRKVDGNTKVNAGVTEKIIVLDKQTGDIVPVWKRLIGGNFLYYFVANNKDTSNFVESKGLICKIKDFINDREVAISVNFRASCSVGNEEKLAKALLGNNHPGEQLAEKIQIFFDEFSRKKATDFIESYSINQLRELQNRVEKQVIDQIGLNFELRLALAYEEKIKPFSTGIIEFPVHVSDCNDELNLQLKIELVVDEQNKVKALANLGHEILLVNLIEQEIKKYLFEKTTLHKFCFHLKDTLRNDIVNYLNRNSLLSQKGRKVSFLSLNSNTIPVLPDEIVEIQYDVECKYEGYPEPKPILVRNTVQMFLEDVGKYRLAEVNDLTTWVKGKLEKIVKPSLIYKEYIDILLDFEPIALQIKQDMEKEVKIIGYNIKQIVSRPNLKLLEIIKSFYLEIEEEIFATKDANVKVKLNILVSGKIEEPRKIKDYLNPDSDIEGLMKRTISHAVRDVLNSIEPERYYLRFGFPAVDEITGKAIEKSVEQELTDKIKEGLEKDFYAKLSTVISKPLNTEITEKYQELYRQIGKFEFEVPSLKSDEPPVQFQGDFQIDGVEKDSWYIFQSRLPSINDIKQSIATSLKAKLNTFDDEILQYRDTENLLILENFINEWINRPLSRGSIANQFGLKISIGNLSRSRTAIEEDRSKINQGLQTVELKGVQANLIARNQQIDTQIQINAEKQKAKSLELSKLYDERSRLLISGDEEDIEELNRKISDLEKDVLSPSVDDAKDKFEKLKPKKSTSKSLSEITEQMNKLTSKNNPVINPASDIDVPKKD
ncbi:hypothetical protein PN450_23695 [Dolichospermum lemmermannii CS-548]|uniref:hypothetical protein n=1 Tax=Dolichospermum lemmermannii TaxID=54295 RepID=UPI00232C0519|nr:hypothetical protein [Dolichospermum lemmermannii]MDB9439726.1 hypothetical protein [Dolichospermum lemmermannii CS-548]